MQQSNVRHFLRISELYLRITEQSRSAANIEEVAPLIFSEKNMGNIDMAIEIHDKPGENALAV